MGERNYFIVFTIAAMLAIQYFLSKHPNPFAAFIVPMIYMIILTGLFIFDMIQHVIVFLLLLLLGLLYLLREWFEAQKSLKSK
ncbi:uncharacterized protein HemY [Cerasibacillus quisquiliarum]|uniref:Uncharacterized protein n=1 Tax=Cerasibacillus quisquiliarum TaxID=227865 RepID=A0A511V2N3_9BACI|nr:hypothetical protein [Cerasibacillus quisquiliarum]MBB5146772.1 uncharacterized protein HemY [Cerasibacillus quisquiliarum]GEN31572.1 hypothetical protein CQU01_18100 [Cerasibacillus quisquiliarum]